MITVRPAIPADASQITDLINTIIKTGGTTAHQTLFDDARMLNHYLAPEDLVSCMVAYKDDELLGFQSLKWPEPDANPPDRVWGYIASFVKEGQQGKGVGYRLFSATKSAAQSAGVNAIDATIRADNIGGLAFYEKMGFRESARFSAPLTDGTSVDRIRKDLLL